MAALATPQDVASRWRPLSPDELALAQVWLDEASGLIRLRVPTVDARMVADPNYAAVVVGVIVRSVLRTMKNPDGKSEEQIDDYRYRRASAVADGSLYVSDTDLALLSPNGGIGSAYTISPIGSPGYAPRPLNWWELNL